MRGMAEGLPTRSKKTQDMVDESEYSPQATVAYLRAQGYSDDEVQRILDAI